MRSDWQPPITPGRKSEMEGGCGVIGLACIEKVDGKHLLPALEQMCNRGNGKGGGIAAVGLSAKALGVSPIVLEQDTLLAIAYLNSSSRREVEKQLIDPTFVVDHVHPMSPLSHFTKHKGPQIRPPEVFLYFVRVKKTVSDAFRDRHRLHALPLSVIEDQIVYQNSYTLNRTFYTSAGEKTAFVLSHGKNLLVLKMVGYADDVIRAYQLENFPAHVWIGHHRYPTKGRVWHPGGAHPFIGLNEALVHNGDFANYFSMVEYLAQRKIYPLFLTDTEVAALLFDLLHRTYGYPLEYVIEAFAPTTERDFALLPEDKKKIYEQIRKTHIHGSPDGPWFFLLAQSQQSPPPAFRLIGITDTSMLRPQVFALQQGEASIGLVASEKQAIDATLQSLSQENQRFWPHADVYWNARGGSYTDGGAFTFTVSSQGQEGMSLACTDKFGRMIHPHPTSEAYVSKKHIPFPLRFPDLSASDLFSWVTGQLKEWSYEQVQSFLTSLCQRTSTDEERARTISVVTSLIDQRYPTGALRRSCLVGFYHQCLAQLVEMIRQAPTAAYAVLQDGRFSGNPEQTVVVDARGLASEGKDSLARAIVKLFQSGTKKFLIIHCQGQRFIGNGLGPDSRGVRIDVYGSSGDYLASGIDGAELIVHGDGQDQLAQIMKDGTFVVHGNVGQTFMYGAKGGTVFVRGDAAGRPLINAVGKPRVVINGTCLDYLAESFMAGNPLEGGGFVVVNGLATDDRGTLTELDTPYPGNNLFSLASGGAIYMRDPGGKVVKDQLNGGAFVEMTLPDWELILPYLETNARLFGIPVSRLLEHEGKSLNFHQVYRKIRPQQVRALQEEEAWVKG